MTIAKDLVFEFHAAEMFAPWAQHDNNSAVRIFRDLMISLLLKRFFHGLIVLWVVATLTFLLLRAAPGGPFDSDRKLPPEVIANLEAKYHLDEPVWQQYLRYLAGIAQGDFGPSYKYLDRGVTEIIADTLPTSVLLGGLALCFALLISFPSALVAAYYRNSIIDRFCMFIATLGISLPNFILGALLIWAVALKLGWLYAARWDRWSSAILPMITLGAAPAAYLAALLRSTLIDTFGEDFIRTARAKGLKESTVVVKHALRHSLIPVLTVMGPLAAALLTGSFVVEFVFAIPGMGRFFITAVTDRDYPLIMGVTLIYTAILVSANFLVDVLYGYVDPRIRTH